MRHIKILKFILVASGIIAIFLMAIDYFISNPPIPLEERIHEYEGNIEGIFWWYVLFVLIELTVCYFLVFFRPDKKKLIQLIIFLIGAVAWTVFSFFQTMHGGGVKAIYALWQVVVIFCVLCLLMILVIEKVGNKKV